MPCDLRVANESVHYWVLTKSQLYAVGKVVFYWDQPFLVGWVWIFVCWVGSIGKKKNLVCLIDQLFQPASNQAETVQNEWVGTTIV